MRNASLFADPFHHILERLPAGLDLDALAVETKAIERRREITSGGDLLRLALARGPGRMSLSQTAAWAGLIGLGELSSPGLKNRLDKAAGFLDGIVTHLLALRSGGSTPVHWPGRFLSAADGSTISQTGSIGTDWRVHGVFDLGRGCFSHLALTDCHGAEAMTRGPAIPGEIRIGDRNYARAGVLQDLCRAGSAGSSVDLAGDSVDFIVRMSWRAFALTTPSGRDFDLIDHLQHLPDDTLPHEVCVLARARDTISGRERPSLPLRLVIQRKSPEAAEAARRKLPRQAQRKQKKLDPRTVVAAGFMILATSLPDGPYPAAEVLAAYRLRWQIELAFKRLKSLLHIGQLPTRTKQAARSWLLAHLILALLCDDVTQGLLGSSP